MTFDHQFRGTSAALEGDFDSEFEQVPESAKADRSGLRRLAFVCVVLFYGVYFLRPQDIIPGLAVVPIAKIFGVLAILALGLGLVARAIHLTREIVLLLLFLFYLCLTIPFSIWPGGAFDVVVFGAAKAIVIPIAAMGVLTTVTRFRRLLLVQTFAMLILAISSLAHYSGGRMFGVGSMFGDPNELALDICIVLPVCVAMLMTTKNFFKKIFWIAAIALFLFAIVLTYSRGGFLALLVVCLTVPWRFRFKLKSTLGLAGLGTAILFVAVVVAGSSSYIERIKSITNPDADTSGSSAYRQELLMASIRTTFEHPIFGVGPGQFMQVSGSWHQSHNTYTQISSDAGIPALLIFLVIMWTTARNLARAKRSVPVDQMWYLTAAVHCGLLSYLVGGAFLSTAYWFVPYLLVAYGASVSKIIPSQSPVQQPPEALPEAVWS